MEACSPLLKLMNLSGHSDKQRERPEQGDIWGCPKTFFNQAPVTFPLGLFVSRIKNSVSQSWLPFNWDSSAFNHGCGDQTNPRPHISSIQSTFLSPDISPFIIRLFAVLYYDLTASKKRWRPRLICFRWRRFSLMFSFISALKMCLRFALLSPPASRLSVAPVTRPVPFVWLRFAKPAVLAATTHAVTAIHRSRGQ